MRVGDFPQENLRRALDHFRIPKGTVTTSAPRSLRRVLEQFKPQWDAACQATEMFCSAHGSRNTDPIPKMKDRDRQAHHADDERTCNEPYHSPLGFSS